jgi:hypothetical protein
VLKDIDALVDWQLHGGEDAHYWRSSHQSLKGGKCICPECVPTRFDSGRMAPNAIRVDGPVGRAYTVDLSAGTYDVLWLGTLELPLSEPITLDEPGCLVITASGIHPSPDGEVFYVRIGRPRRTRVIEA